MATEMQSMFAAADDPVLWESSTHHVRCYAHKLNLVVGHGLKKLGQKVSTAKPTIPQGVALPIPTLEVNNGDDEIDFDEVDSDEENDENLPDKPDGVDDEDTNQAEEAADKDDVVALALTKVST
jgi:hypothetical protein